MLPLAGWSAEYEAVRRDALESFGVQLPDLPHLVLTERDIQELCAGIFHQNRFGDSLLSEDDRRD